MFMMIDQKPSFSLWYRSEPSLLRACLELAFRAAVGRRLLRLRDAARRLDGHAHHDRHA